MKWKWKKWRFWQNVKSLAEKKMKNAWMQGGNCDSCCPNCKQWESAGCLVTTVDNEDGSVNRKCSGCNYAWNAIFTPAGFIPID